MEQKEQRKGYQLVCPDFGQATSEMSNDAQLRCLSYILPRIPEFAPVPPGILFEVIPLQWHHYGDYYPSIGMTQEPEVMPSVDMCRLSFDLGDRITEYIEALGVDVLLGLSARETLCWTDVLRRHNL